MDVGPLRGKSEPPVAIGPKKVPIAVGRLTQGVFEIQGMQGGEKSQGKWSKQQP